MTLERELALFNDYLRIWLERGYRGKWVCIYGEVLGFYPDMNAALSAGYDRSLSDRARTGEPERGFLVRQITDEPERPVRVNFEPVGVREARDAQVRTEEREACARICDELAAIEEQVLADQHNSKMGTMLAFERLALCHTMARLIRERKE